MNYLKIAQLVLGLLLIISILMQQRGSGLSGTFGGGEGNAYSTRRGVEKIIFAATIIIAVLFFAVSILRITL